MKKIVLMMACAIATSSAFAQYVLGTKDDADFGFMTDDEIRASWLGSGTFIYGADAGSNPATFTDNDPNTTPRLKMVINNSYDLYLKGGNNLFLGDQSRMVSGPTANYPNDNSTSTGLSEFILSHSQDGSALLNSRSGEIFLQPSGGTVWVGKTYYHSYTTNYNTLSVDGAAGADGYSANIKKVTSSTYTVTNEDYTILADASSNSVTITLPTSTGVENGRIFVIKNISSSGTNAVTITNSLDGSGTSTTVNYPNESLMVQLLVTEGDPDTYDYYIISDK